MADGSGTIVASNRIGPGVQLAKLVSGVGVKSPVTPEKTGVEAYQYRWRGPEAFAKLPADVSQIRIWKYAFTPPAIPVRVTA